MDQPKGGLRAWAEAWNWGGLAEMPHRADVAERAAGRSQPLPVADVQGDAPPPPIGQDERRMQVRAFNLWANLLANRSFPDIRGFDAGGNPDFSEYAVLLDFSAGISDPVVLHLGARLADESGIAHAGPFVGQLSDVPAGSLISRITDHYVEILARQSPIGFEAEFVNRHGQLIVYRGILLPFSSDDRHIDHVYGVINWKEVAAEPLAPGQMAGLAADLSEAGGRRLHACGSPETDLPAPLARRLRAMTPSGFDAIADDGPEFTLLMARRLASGNVVLLGEVPADPTLTRRAATRLAER